MGGVVSGAVWKVFDLPAILLTDGKMHFCMTLIKITT